MVAIFLMREELSFYDSLLVFEYPVDESCGVIGLVMVVVMLFGLSE